VAVDAAAQCRLRVIRDWGRTSCRSDQLRYAAETGRNAGFSTSEPWLPLSADFRRENVESQRADPASILNLYRRLIALRRSSRVLTAGAYRPLAAQGDLLLY
jgi:alpha-glucosidase